MSGAFSPDFKFFSFFFCSFSTPLLKGTIYNTWALNDKILRQAGVNAVSAHW